MRQISILFNSVGYLQIDCSSNASKERILEILKKAVVKYEKEIRGGLSVPGYGVCPNCFSKGCSQCKGNSK